MKTIKGTMMAMRSLVLATALATVGIPVVSWAQQVPDALQ